MTTFELGRRAEQAAAVYLKGQGFKVLDQNWRTKWCEIDIVAHKNAVVYFVEVKYRKSASAGTGLDYITPHKVTQITRAALGWVQKHNWRGAYELLAIEVAGDSFIVSSPVEVGY
jgi:uncharacterized protein (TIGR00252 family)